MRDPLVVTTARVPSSATGRQRVRVARTVARLCLRDARCRVGAPPGRRADREGAPLACAGWWWSWSHTTGRAAAVTAPGRIGVDLEALDRATSPALAAALTPAETAHLPAHGPAWSLRAWTVKEALLKALGVGLGGLSRVRLSAPPEQLVSGDSTGDSAGDQLWPLTFDGARHLAWQRDVDGYSLAVCGTHGERWAPEVVSLEVLRSPAPAETSA